MLKQVLNRASANLSIDTFLAGGATAAEPEESESEGDELLEMLAEGSESEADEGLESEAGGEDDFENPVVALGAIAHLSPEKVFQ